MRCYDDHTVAVVAHLTRSSVLHVQPPVSKPLQRCKKVKIHAVRLVVCLLSPTAYRPSVSVKKMCRQTSCPLCAGNHKKIPFFGYPGTGGGGGGTGVKIQKVIRDQFW